MFFEDYVLGSTRRTSSRTITETDIVVHAGQSGDFYPHHMDAEWSSRSEFGQRVAHGTLVFTVGIGLAAADEVNEEAFTYGYDRLRFVRPVFIGDTITSTVTIKESRPYLKRPGFGIIVEDVVVTKQNGDVVMACEHLLLVRRRPSP